MGFDIEKLAESFVVGSRLLSQDERLILASAVEIVALEKDAGRFQSLTEEEAILVAAAVADTLLKE